MIIDFINTGNANNMTATRLSFSVEEYHLRLSKVRQAMVEKDIELLVVTDPSNMAWLTGYDGWSFYVHQCVVLTHEGEPLWFGRGQDAQGAVRTVFMADESIVGYPDHYVQSTQRHPMQYLVEILNRRKLPTDRVGLEMDNYYFSAACYTNLKASLPDCTFVDATGLVNWQRAVKSEQELEYMQNAARIVENMHSYILNNIKPGMLKNELVAGIYHAGITGIDGLGGDYPAIVPLLPSGADAAAPHLTWDDEPIKNNQGTFFEIAGCYKRYHCPLSRTIYLGQPPKQFLNAEKAQLEGIEAALETAKPGNTCAQVEQAWREVIARYGIKKESRIGYPIGLSYPPDWGERTMSLRPGDETILQENMTFHMIPALWMDDWGLEITESFRVTENGAQTFCNYPRHLFIID